MWHCITSLGRSFQILGASKAKLRCIIVLPYKCNSLTISGAQITHQLKITVIDPSCCSARCLKQKMSLTKSLFSCILGKRLYL